jgi:hypothetical protein
MVTIKITGDDVVTVEGPRLTAVRIDAARRLIAIDGISGPADSDLSGPDWTVRDLRGGTFGDFHRLRPSNQCGRRGCAASEHPAPWEA